MGTLKGEKLYRSGKISMLETGLKCTTDIYLSMLDFNGFCKFSNIFIRLQKIFNSGEPKVELPHAGLYNYNGRQIDFFHMKWFLYG